ncbi:hypothetical protein QF027_006293 [Streptomyces canus]|nr:hypothetical protein [Streptomyces canus]
MPVKVTGRRGFHWACQRLEQPAAGPVGTVAWRPPVLRAAESGDAWTWWRPDMATPDSPIPWPGGRWLTGTVAWRPRIYGRLGLRGPWLGVTWPAVPRPCGVPACGPLTDRHRGLAASRPVGSVVRGRRGSASPGPPTPDPLPSDPFPSVPAPSAAWSVGTVARRPLVRQCPHRSCGLSGSEPVQPRAPNGLGRAGPRRTRPRGGDTHPVRGPGPGGPRGRRPLLDAALCDLSGRYGQRRRGGPEPSSGGAGAPHSPKGGAPRRRTRCPRPHDHAGPNSPGRRKPVSGRSHDRAHAALHALPGGAAPTP